MKGSGLLIIALSATVALALCGCAGAGAGGGESVSSSTQTATVDLVEGNMSADELGKLESELYEKFGYGTYEARRLADEDGWIHLRVRKRPAGIWYDAYLGDRFMAYPVESGGTSSSTSSSSSSTTPAEEVDAKSLAGQGQSSLTSTGTEFDTSNAWPLSMHDRVDPLIGEKVASGLLQDINVYLAKYGAVVSDEVDIDVSADGIERAGGMVTFRVLVMAGNDRVVLELSYDEATMRHSIERLP